MELWPVITISTSWENGGRDGKIPYNKLTIDDMKAIAEKTAGVYKRLILLYMLINLCILL